MQFPGAVLGIFVACWWRATCIEVLYTGAPRTGTQTMFKVLSTLGYRSMHSGYEIREFRHSRTPCNHYICGNGTAAACVDSLEGYGAAMDEPFHLLYEEVLQKFPTAKIILPDVTSQDWYASFIRYNAVGVPREHVREQVLAGNSLLQQRAFEVKQPSAAVPYTADDRVVDKECMGARYWGCNFYLARALGNFDPNYEKCIDGFNKHMDRVREVVPADQLLVFKLSDGWEPLCKFLGKPVPDEPFPYTDIYNSEHSPLVNSDDDESLVASGAILKR